MDACRFSYCLGSVHFNPNTGSVDFGAWWHRQDGKYRAAMYRPLASTPRLRVNPDDLTKPGSANVLYLTNAASGTAGSSVDGVVFRDTAIADAYRSR